MQNIELDDDKYCFACGRENPSGLKLSFTYADRKITAEFTPSKNHQGYKNITHGGIITTILDEAMIQAAIAEGVTPVTAEITIRFKKPLMADETVFVEAEIQKRGAKLIEGSARLYRKADAVLIAEANAKMIAAK